MASASGLEPALGYQGPERLSGEPPSPADDVWAVGVVLYVALTGEEPFESDDREHAAPIESHGIDAPGVQGALDRIFHAEQSERILSAHDLVAVLSKQHPDPDEMLPLELPIEGVRSAHRVRHVSQQVMEAVREEVESLRPTAPGEPPEAFEENEPSQPDVDDVLDPDARSSEVEFLGWLSEPPSEVAAKPPASVSTPEIETEPVSVSQRELLPDSDAQPELEADEEKAEAEAAPDSEPESDEEPEPEPDEDEDEAPEPDEDEDEDEEPDEGEEPDEDEEPEPDEDEEPDEDAEPAAAAQPRRAAEDRPNNNLLWMIGAVVVATIAYFALREPEAPAPTPTKPVATSKPTPTQPQAPDPVPSSTASTATPPGPSAASTSGPGAASARLHVINA